MAYIRFPVPPNLPLATPEYERTYHDQFANVLRLYFNRLNGNLQTVFGPYGGQYILSPLGSFYDTTDQIAASTTVAYPITFSNTAISNGVKIVSSSQLRFEYPGYYNIQFSTQLSNLDNAPQDIDIWFRKNGQDIADSNSRFGLAPRKSAGVAFHLIGALNFIVDVTPNDYIQLYWCTSSVNTYLEYYTALSLPTRPAIPSVILTATLVSGVE